MRETACRGVGAARTGTGARNGVGAGKRAIALLGAAASTAGLLAIGVPRATAASSTWSSVTDIGAKQITAVSCSGSTFCEGVDQSGAAIGYNGSTWTASRIDGGHALKAISCTSSTFCMAVDDNGHAFKYTGSWDAGTAIDGTVALLGISCVGSSFCEAVDVSGKAVQYSAGAWGSATSVDSTVTINSISCVSTTFCWAVDNAGRAGEYTGSWGAFSSVGPSTAVTSVSCASASFCVAVDSAGKALTYTTSWSSASTVDGTNTVNSVSCKTTTFCWAVDASGNAAEYTGSWGTFSSVDSTNSMTAVSCPATSFCVAVDTLGNASTSTGSSWSAFQPENHATLLSISCAGTSYCMANDQGGASWTFNGTSWSSSFVLPSGEITPNANSCVSSSFCDLVDRSGNVLTWNGASWSSPSSIDGTNQLDSISCRATNFCIAVDATGKFLKWTTSWTSASSIDASALNSVSCPTTSFCMAVDTTGKFTDTSNGGTSWSAASSFDGTTTVNSVSCTSASFCMAVDASGNAFAFNGSNWTTLTTWANPVDSGNSLKSVSCVSTACSAVDLAGNEVSFTGSSWGAVEDFDSANAVNSVACTSSTSCIAVDAVGYAVSYDASSGWGSVSTNSALQAQVGDLFGATSLTGTNDVVAVGDDATSSYGQVSFTNTSAGPYSYGVVKVFNGSAVTSQPATSTDIDGSNTLDAVSCPTVSMCAATDSATSGSMCNSGSGTLGRVCFVNPGNSWSSSASPVFSSGNTIDAVSCPSTTLCIALARETACCASKFQAYYTTNPASGSSSTWTTGSVMTIDSCCSTSNHVTGLSCPSTSFCVAVDTSGNAWTTTSPAATGAWTLHSIDGSTQLNSVSCTSTTFCVAVDNNSTSNAIYTTNEYSSSTSVSFGGGTAFGVSCVVGTTFCGAVTATYGVQCSPCTAWSQSSSQNMEASNTLTAISCSSATSCAAVDNKGNAFFYDGTNTWNESNVDNGTSLNADSCPSPSFCVAVDSAGHAVELSYGGTPAWTTHGVDGSYTVNSVSCPTTSFCTAVDSDGNAVYTSDGGSTWTTICISASSIGGSSCTSGNNLYGVSCASATFCTAVTANYAIMWKGAGSPWSASNLTSTNIDSHQLTSISCPASTSCVAMDVNGGSVTYSSGTWSSVNQFDGPCCGGTGYQLVGVSCPTTSFCMSMDNGQVTGCCTGSSSNGYYHVSTNGGSSWPTGGTADGSNIATDVSCPSTTTCVEISDVQTVATTSNANCGSGCMTWTSPVSLNNLLQGSGSGDTLAHVSCAPGTVYCDVTDSQSTAGRLFTDDNGTWSYLAIDSGHTTRGVSCASSSFCVVGDNAGNLLVYAPSTSSGSTLVTGPLYSVSCPTSSDCVAVGLNSSFSGGEIVTASDPLDPNSWTSVSVPAGVGDIFSVTCASTTSCYAVGTTTSGGATILYYNGSAWSAQTVPTNLGTVTGLYGVACIPGATNDCFAVGQGVNGGTTDGVIVYTSNGGSGATWSTETYTASGGLLSGVACTSTPSCVVSGDGGGYTYVYYDLSPVGSPGTWLGTDQVSQTGNSYLYGVACSSTSICYAYGWTLGQGTIWQNGNLANAPTSWVQVEKGALGDVAWFAMACPSTSCLAVGSNGASPYYPVGEYGS